MDRTLSQKSTRQFSPLILYHKDYSLDHQRHQDKKPCQFHSINREARICQHLEETNKMLARNAQLWSTQEDYYATLFDGATSHKKGFVSVILANETTTDQNENDINNIIPSSSASSTLSNSSTVSGDSITIITTPVCPTKSIPMSSLVITPPPPPPPLYHQPNTHNDSDLCQNDDQYYRHFHQPLSSSFQESKKSSPSRYVARSMSPNQPTVHTEFVAPFTSSPHYSRSVTTEAGDALEYSSKTPRVAALLSPPTSTSPPSSSPSFTQPSGRKNEMTGLGIKKRRRQNLSKHVTEMLKYWLLQHKEHPYPTERQKLELAQRTDLGVNQISNWFINARRRILHPMIETEQQLLAQQQQHQQQQQYMYMTHSSYRNQYQQRRYYSSTKSPPILLYNGEEGKPQNAYAVSYGPEEPLHDTQHWSVPRPKLPTIEIP